MNTPNTHTIICELFLGKITEKEKKRENSSDTGKPQPLYGPFPVSFEETLGPNPSDFDTFEILPRKKRTHT